MEQFVPPRKGTRHVLRLIRDILFLQPGTSGTPRCRQGLDFLNRVLRRRAIVFLFSDFLDGSSGNASNINGGLAKVLQRTGKRHDLVGIALSDPREHELPAVGLLELTDAETGRRSSSIRPAPKVQAGAAAANAAAVCKSLRQIAQSARIDLIEVSTDGGHLDALLRFFRLRERRMGRV